MKRFGSVKILLFLCLSFLFNISAAQAATNIIDDQSFSGSLCDLNAPRYIQLDYIAQPNEQVSFNMLSGVGSIDPVSGLITYTPDTSGVFVFTIEAVAGSLYDTATITDELILNTPPKVYCYDSTVYLCDVEQICFDVAADDVDNDELQIYMLEGIGDFNMTDTQNGQACFTPADVDSATYMFIFRAADSCVLGVADPKSATDFGQCCTDTSLITVVINKPPVMADLEPIEIFTCDVDTLCYDLEVTNNEFEDLTFTAFTDELHQENIYTDGAKLCVIADGNDEYLVYATVTDTCGHADTITVSVTTTRNSAPYVSTADDFEANFCLPELICFDAYADDVDFNIENVTVNFGDYNPNTNKVCFTPDTAGVYTFEFIATDVCGQADTAYTNVTVDFNDEPQLYLGEDYALSICGGEEICVEPTITDDNLNRVNTNFSFYNNETKKICFTPDTAGVYSLIVELVDDCELTAVDTLNITVDLKPTSYVNLGTDQSAELCAPEEICFPIETNAGYGLVLNFGTYADGQICFTPDTAGVYRFVASVDDSCGVFSADTLDYFVSYTVAPEISGFEDLDFYLCKPEMVCVPLNVTDVDNNIVSIVSNRGSYQDGKICFVPYDSGSYPIIVTVTDECGFEAVDTAIVHVSTDQWIDIIVPNDTSFFTCELDTVCFPIYGIPDNAEVSVTGINTWFNAETNEVCYYPECSSNNKITVSVATECNTFVEEFNVTVHCNTEPLVILPQDTSIFLCNPGEICLPVGIKDFDGNLDSVIVVGAEYNKDFSTLCFTPEANGEYFISVTVIDSCGATDYDEIYLNVEINEPPVCQIPNDTTVFFCNPGELTVPLSGLDVNGNLESCSLISGPGTYQDGMWTYHAMADEEITLVFRCVDSCGASCTDSVKINLDLNEAPVCDIPNDTTVYLCQPGEIKLPVSATDAEGGQISCMVTDGPGEIVDSFWVYTPTGSENINVTIRCTDDCGAYCESTFSLGIEINDTPVCNLPNDTALFVCADTEIMLPVSSSDNGSTICEIIDGPGTLVDGMWHYTPETSGQVTVTVRCTDECETSCEGSFTVDITMNSAPVCELPESRTLTICDLSIVSLPLSATDVDENLVSCTIVDGPGEIVDGFWNYAPNGNESVTVTVRCEDECGAFCEGSFTINIIMNNPPVIEDQNFAGFECYPGTERTLNFEYSDPDGDELSYIIVSNVTYGTPENGVITYVPTESGTYTFEVYVYDNCDTTMAIITDEVTFNSEPVVNTYDTTVVMCDVSEICLPITAFDADGDSLIILQYEGPGTFTQLDGSSGQVCFTPEAVDSATYYFIYCVNDSCSYVINKSIPPVCADTVAVTVLLNRPPVLTCPEPAEYFVCDVDTFCVDISASDPDGEELTYTLLDEASYEGAVYLNGNQLCVIGSETAEYNIGIMVSDACGEVDSCRVPVSITANTPPVVNSANDFTTSFCLAEEVCFPVSVLDVDENLDVILTNIGTYDAVNNQVCFTPDTSGTYTVITTAKDLCGEEDVDTTMVTVDINTPPVVDLGTERSISLCEPGQVCLDVSITDDNLASVLTSLGAYNAETGQLCFDADTSGVYEITATVTDECEAEVIKTVLVNVYISEGPVLSLGDDFSSFLCEPTEICVDVATIDNIESYTNSEFTSYNAVDHKLCFTPDTAGTYTLAMSVTDTCGISAYDTVLIDVSFNNDPTITANTVDTTVALCEANEICIELTPSDIDDNIASVWTNFGTYTPETGLVCFMPDTTGIYTMTAYVKDECDKTDSVDITIRVELNDTPVVDLGEDYTLSLCTLTDVCLEYNITDNNIVDIIVDGATYNSEDNSICFLPETSGTYQVIVTAVDDCGLSASDTVNITVNVAEQPFVNLGDDFNRTACEIGEICIDVNTIANYQTLDVTPGATYNPQTSQLCFTPDKSGVFTLIMAITDTCGTSAADTINVTVDLNTAPEFTIPLPDTSVYLCQPENICLPLNLFDAEDNIVSITSNRGTISDGQVCFVPYDSGQYEIIVTAVDECGATAVDTAVVTVVTDQLVNLVVPNDTTLFVCELETMCFPVYGIPENATVSVTGINIWFDAETNNICFTPECATANKITLKVSTPCNDFVETFTITVNCNTQPLVILPPDTTIILCSPSEICIPVGASDVDHNLVSITAEGGVYDATFSKICFDADTSGLYKLTAIATDECGATDSDEIFVRVVINSAPAIEFTPEDTVYVSCLAEAVCFPINIYDIDNNLTTVTTSIGSYNSETGQICFVPTTSGQYCIDIAAVDECGLKTEYQACVDVRIGEVVTFECPELLTADSLCNPGDLACVPLNIQGNGITVETSIGTFENGQLCFTADTAGLYTVTVTASGECNTITCEVPVRVNMRVPLEITCPGDVVDTFLCPFDTLLAYDYQVSESVLEVSVSEPAYLADGMVYLPVHETGTYNVTMIATGECGADTCSFEVNARINSRPVVNVADTSLIVCELETVCVDFTATDIDNNIMNFVASEGTIDGNTLCYLPTDTGSHDIIIYATDSCGTIGQDTLTITVNYGPSAVIDLCPGDQFETLCGPQEVCKTLIITPSDAEVTIYDNGEIAQNASYNIINGSLCIYIDQAGSHDIMVVADALCGSDTCEFNLTASIADLPKVTVPSSLEEVLCLTEPINYCFPITATGTGIDVTVSNGGQYTAGIVCVPIDTAGEYVFEIIAASTCGADTGYTTLTVTAEEGPILYLPEYSSYQWCPGDTNHITIDGIYATDNNEVLSLTQVCGVADSYTAIRVDSGYISFVPDTAGLYEFCFEASDGCSVVSGSFEVEIFEKEDCDVCVQAAIVSEGAVPVGVIKDVSINVNTNDPIGGFNLLISYDAAVVSFNTATIVGTEIEEWEYFTFRLGSDDCGPSCPSGMVRFIGIADVNNGAEHPPISSLSPSGELIRLKFQIANDQNLGDQFLPINFFWFGCGDNTFSNPSGNLLYLDSRIYNPEMIMLWDEEDDTNYPEESRPFGIGAVDSCLAGDKTEPVRCVEFINGGIHVIHPDDIDDRGDINLNSIAYEIADAVLYSNYFIYGLKVFDINAAGQIAASDVNADGLTLSVADLVMLIRVIIGDVPPIPKLAPVDESLLLSSRRTPNGIAVDAEAVTTIGAAYMAYNIPEGMHIIDVTAGIDAVDMDLNYNITDGQLRVLIYNIGQNYIDNPVAELMEIAYDGEGELTLAESDFATYDAQSYTVVSKFNNLPSAFELSQNYPNPFNPSTNIKLSLPYPTDWRLSIFNIQGHLVRNFSGNDQAGLVTIEWDGRNDNGAKVSSGVYLYRLEAGDFSDTKKMILLK